jgi:hypothetical protein
MSSGYIDLPAYGDSHWKSPVSTAAALPANNNQSGDVRATLDTDLLYIWTGSAWTQVSGGGGGGGTVTSVSVITANGLAGTVANPNSTPAITLSTSVTGIMYGNGTSIVAAVAGNFPTLNQNTTGTASNITASSNSTLTTLSSLVLPGSQVSGNIPGNAANVTAASNSTLVTLSALSLPYSQLTGVPPISGFTQGSVLFANVSGQISQDNANFFWNDSNVSLGIGTAVPASNTSIDIVNSTGAAKSLRMTGYGIGSSVGVKNQFARGTVGSPTPAQSGDILSFISGTGYGTSFPASTGVLNIVAGETFSGTSNATYITLSTTPTGSVTKLERMRVNSTGNILIGTTTDNSADLVQVNGGTSASYSKLAGASSGYVEQTVPSSVTSYTLTWPSAQGGVSTVPVNNGSGTLSWTSFPSPYLVSTVSTNTTAVSGTTYLCNTSGAGFTVTLPSPASGAFIGIKDSTGSFQTNQLTIAPFAAESIEGLAASKVLYTNWGAWSFFSDGTNWFMGPF